MSKWTKIDNVKGFVKRYDENLKKKYDDPLREILKNRLGDFIEDNPDQYQQDFIITCDKCAFKYLEVQVCVNWINDYPYDKLFLYSRKLKYNDDTLFITFSRSLEEGYLFKMRDILKNKPRRLKKYSREFVYDVPWHKTIKIATKYLDKDLFLEIA